MPVREHQVSFRNGPQVMVAGLRLTDIGYRRGAHVIVSDPSGHPANGAWQFVVENDEIATMVSRNPQPPAWIQAGVRVRIEVRPRTHSLLLGESAHSADLGGATLSGTDTTLPTERDRPVEELPLPGDEPTFRGNVGNLLQHWVLCEVLSACQNHYERLGFIDAYSMAPFAHRHPERHATSLLFDAVAERLPGEQSLYERAWLRLAPNTHEYPNSAAFVTVAWRGRYAMLLCESHPTTAQRLKQWAGVARQFPACEGIEVASGDWRGCFQGPLLPSSDLHFLSFDPYRFDRHGSSRMFGNMVPADLDQLVSVVDRISGGVVVQLSTYSANNDNAQADVREVIISRLASAGLQEVALVRADGNMMSLVFVRDVERSEAVRSLPARFERWLDRFRT